jgi:hypothetical protein
MPKVPLRREATPMPKVITVCQVDLAVILPPVNNHMVVIHTRKIPVVSEVDILRRNLVVIRDNKDPIQDSHRRIHRKAVILGVNRVVALVDRQVVLVLVLVLLVAVSCPMINARND